MYIQYCEKKKPKLWHSKKVAITETMKPGMGRGKGKDNQAAWEIKGQACIAPRT
jgi:hypothetical protein